MVQFVIVADAGATLCRLTLAPTSTVAQLLQQIFLVRPELRSTTRVIRNDARGAVFVVAGAPDASLRLTLQQATLTAAEATVETLVFSSQAVVPPSSSQSAAASASAAAASATSNTTSSSGGGSAPPNSSDAVAARILEMFSAGSNRSTSAATPPSAQPPPPQPQQQSSPLPATTVAVPAPGGAQEEGSVFNPDALSPAQVELQQRLYAAIHQRQIDENLANALEYTPEVFAPVVMLYVPCTINQVPLKAFVDSGAQKSILNRATAERCGLMRLLDTRMSGFAVGVGRQRILGQIHMAPVNIAGMYIPFAFSVLESQDMDLIIGLDQLKRHQMVIDLKNNRLTIDEAHVPFLSEGEIPKPKAMEPYPQDEEGGDVFAGSGGGGGGAEEDEHWQQQQERQQRGCANRHVDVPRTLPQHLDEQRSSPSSPAAAAASAAAAVSGSDVSVAELVPAPVHTPATSTTTASPVTADETAGMPQTEAEKAARVEGFMSFTGITDPEQAKSLLEAVGWDADAAAALYFDAA
ncbi:Dna-damage inducible protein DDI1-like protein [Leptomonas pyrrhocoris]|uniref:Dna-damage inducible protein DDI1-like protein n=1 Tax=Leptomonas pyrrhocoris TaxID=157538 RepID=A0A0N0VCU8_LEPPY|nr:Dna-damage inducible protein DDI1-like protein [Leptomonas pyrrhocoris]XP_015652183.1 Dna-damage inducible protein DDI1-like protein [Leptomonas pyrrhocoris]KPA73743.1 Dna-damage inducible protein DDI1-like protein [Leptomonas pyrrhocoris]KPA73744.1 Dna-damage inducible protein DDI1-like protein [Leptomonas pyrrhocoris]|eukprot:XP_015652182.1 Dna-damage inducible protein DDI1-like protein [Leptomonas pyrrhocoris]